MTDKPKLPWPEVPGTEGKWIAMPKEHAMSFYRLCKALSGNMGGIVNLNQVEFIVKELWEEIFEVK